jgi:hypothetical protein
MTLHFHFCTLRAKYSSPYHHQIFLAIALNLNSSSLCKFGQREETQERIGEMEDCTCVCGTKAKREVEWVYRISAQAEWQELQHKGSSLGGDLDRTTRCIHLSDLNQVPPPPLPVIVSRV